MISSRPWPSKVNQDLIQIKNAIKTKDMDLLGRTAESNALAMHATMLSSWPPVLYMLPETIEAMQKVWDLRQQGKAIYFTQDAGPNLKLLFLKDDAEAVCANFPDVKIVLPFSHSI